MKTIKILINMNLIAIQQLMKTVYKLVNLLIKLIH